MRKTPKRPVQYRTRVLPRSASPIGSSFRTKQRLENRPLGVGKAHILDFTPFVTSFNRSAP